MGIVPLALPTGSNPQATLQGGAQDLVNMYLEASVGKEAKVPYYLRGAEGLRGFVRLGNGATGGIRAMRQVDGVLFAVAGGQLHQVTTTGVDTLCGSMAIDLTKPLYLERNRRSPADVMVSCNGLAYYWRSPSLTQITDADMLPPLATTFVDGYFVNSSTSNQIQTNVLDDAGNWNALDFNRADANPDTNVTVNRVGAQLLVFGLESIEIYQNTGKINFPFDRVWTVEKGCIAPLSVQRLAGTVVWVAEDKSVCRLDGYAAVPISIPALEDDIDKLTDPTIIRSGWWARGGHQFYLLTAPGFWTWCYDAQTKKWHRRKSFGLNYYNIACLERFNNKVYAGSASDPIIYEMNPNFLDDDGAPIVSEVTFSPLHAFPHDLTVDGLFFDLERGVGSGQGNAQDIDPHIMVSVSRDGGYSFGDERVLGLGKLGQRLQQVSDTSFGQFSEVGCTVKLSMFAKHARSLYQARAAIEVNPK